MPSDTPVEQVDSVLRELDLAEPVSFDLGTPELCVNEPVRQLVARGTPIVPYLLDYLRGDIPKKRVAYIVLALREIGDIRALTLLIDLRARYQKREPKDEWDYAVIGQCNLAIEQFQKSTG
jgi:hypothetical protein